MAGRVLYLHIGAPKAASTTLQKQVFPRLNGLTYIHKPIFGLADGRNSWDGELARMVLYSSRIWDRFGRLFFEKLMSEVEKAGGPDQHVLVSDENMSVNRAIDPVHLGNHLTEIRKLATSYGFDTVKLLFIMRRQDEWLASAYAQTSNRLMFAGQRHFDRWLNRKADAQLEYYLRGIALDYLAIYNEIAGVFGERNLLFLPLEMMPDDPAGFISGITDFFGVKGLDHTEIEKLALKQLNVRSGISNGNISLKKWRLRPKYRWMKWHKRYIQLDPGLSEKVLAVYKNSNKLISEKIGVDLGVFGYY